MWVKVPILKPPTPSMVGATELAAPSRAMEVWATLIIKSASIILLVLEVPFEIDYRIDRLVLRMFGDTTYNFEGHPTGKRGVGGSRPICQVNCPRRRSTDLPRKHPRSKPTRSALASAAAMWSMGQCKAWFTAPARRKMPQEFKPIGSILNNTRS